MNTKKPISKSSKKTLAKPEIKKPRGQQPKYFPWMDNIAKKLANEGKKQKDIYDILGISETTGIKYKKKYKEFSKAGEY